MVATIFSGSDDLIVILVAVVVLFGGSQLPKLARNTGDALREFRKAKTEAEEGASPAAGAAPVLPTTSAPVLSPAPVAPGGPAQAPSSDTVTLTRAELDSLLAARAAQAQADGPKAGA